MAIGGARALQAVILAIEQMPGFHASLESLRALDMRFFSLGAEMSRVYHHRLRGEETRAQQVMLETELGVVQLGNAWTYDVVQAWVSAIAYGLTGDVLSLRRVVDDLERLDRAGMRLSSFAVLARSELLRLQGDPDGACALLDAELDQLRPSQGLLRLVLRASLVDARLEAEDVESALALARADPPRRSGGDRSSTVACASALLARGGAGSPGVLAAGAGRGRRTRRGLRRSRQPVAGRDDPRGRGRGGGRSG